jgi:hypothetical protein
MCALLGVGILVGRNPAQHFFVLTFQGTQPFEGNIYHTTSPVRIYTDATTSIIPDVLEAGSGVACNYTISGRLYP